MSPRRWSRLILVPVTVLVMLGILAARQLAPAHASGCGFDTETATTSNTTGNSMAIWPNDPNFVVMATPNWGTNGVYDNHPVGVWWNGASWSVFNQDGAAMPLGASFNVYNAGYVNQGQLYSHTYIHSATASNSASDYTMLDDSFANNNPNAEILVTPNWSTHGVYDPHPIGVWYTGARWAIFHQDGTAIPTNAAFNVIIWTSVSAITPDNAADLIMVQAKTVNTAGDAVFLDWPTAPTNDYLFVTPSWNPGGTGGTMYNHNLGVYYSPSRNQWGVFSQDRTAMPLGASFNILHLTCTS